MKIDAAVLQAAATLAAAKLQIQSEYERGGRNVPGQGSTTKGADEYLEDSITEVLKVLEDRRARNAAASVETFKALGND